MRRPERARPDINVTPLVDVVLVLLIIFMVVLPQMEAGAAVNLPGITHPDDKTDASHGPLTLSVTASGQVYLEKALLAPDQVVPTLQREHAASPQRKLILKGDKAARYATMRDLFRECRAIGFPGISLQVGERAHAKEKK